MRTPLRFLVLLAAFGLLFARPAVASHMQGGDLTYTSLGSNRYRVMLHIYRDCSGITLSPFTLECRSGGCNTTANVTAAFTQVGSSVIGRQYCATLSGICNGTVTNTESFTYSADVTLLPAARWTLSTSQSARPTTTNITTTSNLYLEATLSNLVPVAGTTGLAIVNNSPVASVQPAFFVPVHQMSVLSNSAFDVDGDSLVYALETPADGCSIPETYAAYPVLAPSPIGTTSPCMVQPPNFPTYTAALPIFVDYDTVGTCPLKTGVPRFSFDGRSGAIAMQPARYLNTPSANGDNKYAAAVKISEYRRINGRYVLVGTMRRELYFMVYDCGTNIMPRLAPSVTLLPTGVGSGSTSVVQPRGQIISVMSGEPVSLLLNATDANSGQAVSLTLDYNATPGTVLQNLSNGQARLTFTPPLNLPTGVYRIAVTAEDNACPIKGIDTQVITFRVTSSLLATRTGAELAVAAYPNPFTSVVQFQLAKPGVQMLTISDNLGRTIATVLSQPDGTVRWQPGTEIPAGLYLARTSTGNQTVRLLRSGAQ